MTRLLLALLLCALPAAHATTLAPAPGPFAVGLKVHQQYDHARVYKTRVSLTTGKPSTGERARPMQMLVWYPAAGAGRPLSFGDYLATGITESDFGLPADEVKRRTAQHLARLAGTEEARRELAQPMLATRDAPARSGRGDRFPVVIYAPSFSASAAENADLCEYLASHGYIVLASASQGARTRAMTDDIEGLETQAADIAYLIAQAAALPQADMERLAVAGFSWGGLANVLAAARDDRIKALVSIDGSVRYFPEFVDGGKAAVPYVTPARLPVPLLYLAQRPRSIEALNRSEKNTAFSLLNRMTYSDVLVATMHPMLHHHFAADGQRFEGVGHADDYDRDEIRAAYGWMARYVHRFLDAYLKGDKAAQAFLANKPEANGVPKRMITMEAQRGSGPAPTREAFAGQLAERGFDKAFELYQEMQARGAGFKLGSDAINAWGYELLHGGMHAESIAIFTFGTRLLPADANLFDSLGEAQEAAGRKDDAARSYRRSLELNPKNGNAVARLKALGVTLTAVPSKQGQ
jgi:dienelactone hydrolase